MRGLFVVLVVFFFKSRGTGSNWLVCLFAFNLSGGCSVCWRLLLRMHQMNHSIVNAVEWHGKHIHSSPQTNITLAICEWRKKMKAVLEFIFPSDFCACCHCLISCCVLCVALLLWHIVQVKFKFLKSLTRSTLPFLLELRTKEITFNWKDVATYIIWQYVS